MSTTLRLSIDRYDRMIQAGVFDGDERIELIRGELRTMNPIGPSHESVVDFLTLWSIKNLSEDEVRVRIQNSIGLTALDSVPQPDVVWVRQRDYTKKRPSANDVLLVIEVADSSRAYDLGEKRDLYATARIAEYWVADLREYAIHVFRKPVRGAYREANVVPSNKVVRPLAFPKLSLRVEKLFTS